MFCCYPLEINNHGIICSMDDPYYSNLYVIALALNYIIETIKVWFCL